MKLEFHHAAWTQAKRYRVALILWAVAVALVASTLGLHTVLLVVAVFAIVGVDWVLAYRWWLGHKRKASSESAEAEPREASWSD